VKKPGSMLASGRDADIFEYGPKSVLRRSRNGRSMVSEARIMEYARAKGYPVPAVEEVSDDGSDMVMERIDGADMLGSLSRRPWTIGRQGKVLADLHLRLHEIPAPDWLPAAAAGAGDRLLHLDLHPLNVILSPKGPVVIDWTNARRGDPSSDVALTWVLIAAGEAPSNWIVNAVSGHARSILIANFLAGFDREEVTRHLSDVVKWKVLDPHMSDKEQAGMWKVVDSAKRASKA
jgi:aminoglycoside phosphotransferase (APT) family kinase protein